MRWRCGWRMTAEGPSPARVRRGARNFAAGLAAEEAVVRHYEARGAPVAERRWRGGGAEIDLIAREGGTVVFVEVKRAATHARAAESLRPAQMARLMAAAAAFLADEPCGQDSPARFDVALVDGTGAVEVLENALGA